MDNDGRGGAGGEWNDENDEAVGVEGGGEWTHLLASSLPPSSPPLILSSLILSHMICCWILFQGS